MNLWPFRPARPVPAPGCVLWNTALELRRRRGIAR